MLNIIFVEFSILNFSISNSKKNLYEDVINPIEKMFTITFPKSKNRANVPKSDGDKNLVQIGIVKNPKPDVTRLEVRKNDEFLINELFILTDKISSQIYNKIKVIVKL